MVNSGTKDVTSWLCVVIGVAGAEGEGVKSVRIVTLVVKVPLTTG